MILQDIIMFIRKLNRLIFYGAFSNANIVQGTQADTARMESISNLPFYQSFREGLNLSLENRLQQANQHYQRALNLLQDRKYQLRDHYMHIYKKLIINNYNLKKAKDLQQNIYNLIKLKKQSKTQSILIYDDYNLLFQVFLKFNPQKAIILGKALLSEKQVQNMSFKHKKMFQFKLGNAYFLLGNYEDAKRKYSECLQEQPGKQLKVMAYNNLALACWWNKNPLISQRVIEPSKNKVDSISSDYLQSRYIFLKAIESSQEPDLLQNEQSKYRLKQAIAEQEFNMSAQFVKKQSILPIFDLVQYYINNQPTQKVKILYWLTTLLKLCQLHDNQPIFDQVSVTLNLLNNERKILQANISNLLKKYQNQIYEIYFSKIQLFLYTSSHQLEQAKESKLRISELQNKYRQQDAYIFKRKYLSDYSLIV